VGGGSCITRAWVMVHGLPFSQGKSQARRTLPGASSPTSPRPLHAAPARCRGWWREAAQESLAGLYMASRGRAVARAHMVVLLERYSTSGLGRQDNRAQLSQDCNRNARHVRVPSPPCIHSSGQSDGCEAKFQSRSQGPPRCIITARCC